MRKTTFLYCFLLVMFLVAESAQAWVTNVEKLASAEPDECYVGIGQPYPDFLPVPPNDPLTCPADAFAKTNQTYVWGSAVVPAVDSPTEQGEQLWFGTGGNILCTTQGAFFSEVSPGGYGSSVCEFGDSQIATQFSNLPPHYGDWRPPRIYQYDLETRTIIDRTPYSDPLRNRCLGLRSAGYNNGVVFLAGGNLGGGLSMFAFNAATGEYLGSQEFTAYRTIRKWLVVNNVLYTGVGTSYTGRILRWTGSVSNPWSFSEVGRVSGVPRELTEYIDGDGRSRIAVSARGIFLSPAIYGTGLSSWQAYSWTEIWSPDQYEPDFVTRTTYVGGGIGFLNGWLYFGTMHIPGNAAGLHITCSIPPYGIPLSSDVCFGAHSEEDATTYSSSISTGTERATSIWRIKNAEDSNNRVTQLLYGEAQLRAFNPDYANSANYPDNLTADDIFPLVPNVGGYEPLLGSSGFNWPYNNYAWVMTVAAGHLFVGTMDYSSLFDPTGGYDAAYGLNTGFDLWRIDDNGDDPPFVEAETITAFAEYPGIYTYRPYGVRTLVKSTDGTKLYLGTATGVNVGAVGQGAGWQLLELAP